MYLLDDSLYRILEEEDYAVVVELRAKEVEEHVLAVALVEFAHHVLNLIRHWEDGGRVRLAGHHTSHISL